MKSFKIMIIALSLSGLALTGCETSHQESDSDGWFGGHTHKETTTTKNPVTGDVKVEHKEQTTP